jgi:hypothetical protein
MTENNSVPGTSLHIIIFCWPRVVESVKQICGSIKHLGHRITVIDASGRAPHDIENCRWVSVNMDLYYGSKFYYAARLFDGDVMLQIQGDAHCDNWEALITTCLQRFRELPHLGVWSPEFDNTGWPTANVSAGVLPGSDLAIVSQTDCIVWALRCEIVLFLKGLDYSTNNIGWGIDWAAMVASYSKSMIAVRDRRINVVHAPGKGYGVDEAYKQMFNFLAQLSPANKALLSVLLKSCGQTAIF